MQKNTAFKYFTNEEIQIYRDQKEILNIEFLGRESTQSPRNETTTTDLIDNIDGKLYWKVHSLVFFIDKKDEPSIPIVQGDLQYRGPWLPWASLPWTSNGY